MRKSSGREFQGLGADRLKAFDPMVVRLADGLKSCMVEEDQRVREGVWVWISSVRYDGARLCRILKERSRILKSMQDLVGSQWSCCRAGVMCSAKGVLVMMRAAAFWTSWRLWSDFQGRPWRRELQ